MPYATQLGSQNVVDTGFHVLVLSLLVPSWFCFGKLAQKARLPQITGYVIGGVICGHSGDCSLPMHVCAKETCNSHKTMLTFRCSCSDLSKGRWRNFALMVVMSRRVLEHAWMSLISWLPPCSESKPSAALLNYV